VFVAWGGMNGISVVENIQVSVLVLMIKKVCLLTIKSRSRV